MPQPIHENKASSHGRPQPQPQVARAQGHCQPTLRCRQPPKARTPSHRHTVPTGRTMASAKMLSARLKWVSRASPDSCTRRHTPTHPHGKRDAPPPPPHAAPWDARAGTHAAPWDARAGTHAAPWDARRRARTHLLLHQHLDGVQALFDFRNFARDLVLVQDQVPLHELVLAGRHNREGKGREGESGGGGGCGGTAKFMQTPHPTYCACWRQAAHPHTTARKLVPCMSTAVHVATCCYP
jgi:hypothetical protein